MTKLSDLSLLKREELFRVLRISITHHSNAIEGTTLTYGETKKLLEEGITASNKSIDEQLIILGFAQAYDIVIREANNKDKILDSSFIKDLHYVIFSNAYKVMPNFIKKPIGAYRTDNVEISGTNLELSTVNKISQDLENLLFRFESNSMDLKQIAEFHALYEKIHPFSDGNGRTGRLIMSFQCIQNDLIPPLIELERKDRYLQYLNLLQTKNEAEPLIEFLKHCQEISLSFISAKNGRRQ